MPSEWTDPHIYLLNDGALGRFVHKEPFKTWALTKLDPDEELLDIGVAISEQFSTGRNEDQMGSVALTNKRIVFVSDSGVTFEEIPLTSIRSAEQVAGFWGKLAIELSDSNRVHFQIKKKTLKHFVPILQQSVRSSTQSD